MPNTLCALYLNPTHRKRITNKVAMGWTHLEPSNASSNLKFNFLGKLEMPNAATRQVLIVQVL